MGVYSSYYWTQESIMRRKPEENTIAMAILWLYERYFLSCYTLYFKQASLQSVFTMMLLTGTKTRSADRGLEYFIFLFINPDSKPSERSNLSKRVILIECYGCCWSIFLSLSPSHSSTCISETCEFESTAIITPHIVNGGMLGKVIGGHSGR